MTNTTVIVKTGVNTEASERKVIMSTLRKSTTNPLTVNADAQIQIDAMVMLKTSLERVLCRRGHTMACILSTAMTPRVKSEATLQNLLAITHT